MASKFFDLKILEDSKEEIVYEIPGLDNIYCVGYSSDLTPCSGAIALLKSEIYPGYCQLFYSHRKSEYENWGVITCTFTPAKTKDGDSIFVKYKNDVIFCIFHHSEKYYTGGEKPSRIIIDTKWGI